MSELEKLIKNSVGFQKIEYKEMIYVPKQKCEVLFEGKFMGYQFYIMNYGTHPCAYVEIPKNNKLYKQNWLESDAISNIEVHGGITYCESNLKEIVKDSWIIGWDYAHLYDYYCFPSQYFIMEKDTKKWTTEEMFEDVVKVIKQVKRYEV